DPERDDAFGMSDVPLVVEPVVPGAHACGAEVAIGGLEEDRAAEACDLRREVERRPHAVDVHVPDACVDVVAAGPHLVEAERLECHGLGPAAGDRVHAALRVTPALELPDLVTVPGPDDPRS